MFIQSIGYKHNDSVNTKDNIYLDEQYHRFSWQFSQFLLSPTWTYLAQSRKVVTLYGDSPVFEGSILRGFIIPTIFFQRVLCSDDFYDEGSLFRHAIKSGKQIRFPELAKSGKQIYFVFPS